MSRHELEAARLRVEEAKRCLEDARELAHRERWRSCSNRVYYACFYAALAVLALDGKGSSKHTGVRSIFLKDYVSTGIFPKSLGKLYADILEARTNADYALEKSLPVDKLQVWLDEAGNFIHAADQYVTMREAQER